MVTSSSSLSLAFIFSSSSLLFFFYFLLPQSFLTSIHLPHLRPISPPTARPYADGALLLSISKILQKSFSIFQPSFSHHPLFPFSSQYQNHQQSKSSSPISIVFTKPFSSLPKSTEHILLSHILYFLQAYKFTATISYRSLLGFAVEQPARLCFFQSSAAHSLSSLNAGPVVPPDPVALHLLQPRFFSRSVGAATDSSPASPTSGSDGSDTPCTAISPSRAVFFSIRSTGAAVAPLRFSSGRASPTPPFRPRALLRPDLLSTASTPPRRHASSLVRSSMLQAGLLWIQPLAPALPLPRAHATSTGRRDPTPANFFSIEAAIISSPQQQPRQFPHSLLQQPTATSGRSAPSSAVSLVPTAITTGKPAHHQPATASPLQPDRPPSSILSRAGFTTHCLPPPAAVLHLHQSSRLPPILPLSSSTVHCFNLLYSIAPPSSASSTAAEFTNKQPRFISSSLLCSTATRTAAKSSPSSCTTARHNSFFQADKNSSKAVLHPLQLLHKQLGNNSLPLPLLFSWMHV